MPKMFVPLLRGCRPPLLHYLSTIQWYYKKLHIVVFHVLHYYSIDKKKLILKWKTIILTYHPLLILPQWTFHGPSHFHMNHMSKLLLRMKFIISKRKKHTWKCDDWLWSREFQNIHREWAYKWKTYKIHLLLQIWKLKHNWHWLGSTVWSSNLCTYMLDFGSTNFIFISETLLNCWS